MAQRSTLNPDLIEVMEATHDTHLTLTNGHRYVCARLLASSSSASAEFSRR